MTLTRRVARKPDEDNKHLMEVSEDHALVSIVVAAARILVEKPSGPNPLPSTVMLNEPDAGTLLRTTALVAALSKENVSLMLAVRAMAVSTTRRLPMEPSATRHVIEVSDVHSEPGRQAESPTLARCVSLTSPKSSPRTVTLAEPVP